MLHLILGRAGSGKTAAVFEEIASRVRAREGSCVVLVPEQFSHEAERELAARAGDALSLYAEVLSFTGLARRVFSSCGGGRPVMDGGGRLLCMAVAAESVSAGLKLYGRSVRDAGALVELLRAVEELKNAGATAESLRAAAEREGGRLGEKLEDLALLTEALQLQESRSGADPADTLRLLAEVIGDSPEVRSRFYVDGFADFTAPESEVLRALLAAGADVTVCLSCLPGDDDSVFALPWSTACRLEQMASDCGQASERHVVTGGEEQSDRRYLCEELFRFGGRQRQSDGSVRLLTARDIYGECELMAAQMLQLARQGCRWRDMAVAVRGYEKYRTAMETVFADYGIPLFGAVRDDILQRNVPLVIARALEAVTRGYEYETMFSLLKTGLAGLRQEETDELENYVLLWNTHGEPWKKPWTRHPQGYNRERDERSVEQLARINELRRRAVTPLAALEMAGRKARTAAEQARALAAYLEDIRLAEQLEARCEQLAQRGRSQTAAEYEQLWNRVCQALEQFANVLGEREMGQGEFASLFMTMLRQYKISVIPVSLDRVQAGEPERMRRRHIKHLFVPGVYEGSFPAPGVRKGLFSPDERDALQELDIRVGGMEEELQREIHTVYSCLSLPSETLTLLRPLRDADGTETAPSLVAKRAGELLGLREEAGDRMGARLQSPQGALAEALNPENAYNPRGAAARQLFLAGDEARGLVSRAAQAVGPRGMLSEASVRSLFGAVPSLSPTKADSWSECRFGYFVKYGLRAEERRTEFFDPREYGTFVHDVLERTVNGVLEEGGFAAVGAERTEELAREAIRAYERRETDNLQESTARFLYQFRRSSRTALAVVRELREEMAGSRFRPLYTELDLSQDGVLAPMEGRAIRLNGKVDRVDGWERDGVLYLRVVDYKTGQKKFRIQDVMDGKNLQMLIYLFALCERGQGFFGTERLEPAGVMYLPARQDSEKTNEAPDDSGGETIRLGSSRRGGLLLDDDEVREAMEPGGARFLPSMRNNAKKPSYVSREKLWALGRWVEARLDAMGEQLRSGDVRAEPLYHTDRDNACQYCACARACYFGSEGDVVRPAEGREDTELWERIVEEYGE